MALNSRPLDRGKVGLAELHLANIVESGCARHPHLVALLGATGREAARNIADAIHLLCALHGRHPGLIEIVHGHSNDPAERDFLNDSATSFERERLYLVRLTAAVGPLPSTPGAAETQASLMVQRNALEVLANSERAGCGLGASCALIGDWRPLRKLLDCTASRVGLDPPEISMPGESEVVEVIEASADTMARSRAFSFGSEQLLLQHRALFDLLEARASARANW